MSPALRSHLDRAPRVLLGALLRLGTLILVQVHCAQDEVRNGDYPGGVDHAAKVQPALCVLPRIGQVSHHHHGKAAHTPGPSVQEVVPRSLESRDRLAEQVPPLSQVPLEHQHDADAEGWHVEQFRGLQIRRHGEDLGEVADRLAHPVCGKVGEPRVVVNLREAEPVGSRRTTGSRQRGNQPLGLPRATPASPSAGLRGRRPWRGEWSCPHDFALPPLLREDAREPAARGCSPPAPRRSRKDAPPCPRSARGTPSPSPRPRP